MDYKNNLPVGQLYVPKIEDFKAVVDNILKTRNYTIDSPLLKELEKELSIYLGVNYVLGVTNGTIALIIALEALHGDGDIITPRYSFPATMNAISMIGANVLYCDTVKDSPNVCLDSLEDKLINNNSISTILIPNLWSTVNDINEISLLSKKYNVSLIYDSSQSFSCSYGGQKISTNGNAEIFSFHATKLITAFEGGCITTNDKSLYEKLIYIRSNFGVEKSNFNSHKSANGYMSELQAGLCLRSLSNIKRSIKHNKKIYTLYKRLLKSKDRYKIFEPNNFKTKSNYQYIILILDRNVTKFRDRLKDHLNSKNILARSYFDYDFSIFNDENPLNFPNSLSLSKSSICLPIGERIKTTDVIYIAETINNYFDTIE